MKTTIEVEMEHCEIVHPLFLSYHRKNTKFLRNLTISSTLYLIFTAFLLHCTTSIFVLICAELYYYFKKGEQFPNIRSLSNIVVSPLPCIIKPWVCKYCMRANKNHDNVSIFFLREGCG